MRVTLFHPFTPSAAAIPEGTVPVFHSQPHVRAMRLLAQQGFACEVHYFTDKHLPYKTENDHVTWRFWPVSARFTKNAKRWMKQSSLAAWVHLALNAPDITIFNMSGMGSSASFALAQLLRRKGKPYIAMLGGQNYRFTPQAQQYYAHANHILVHTELQKQAMLATDFFAGRDIRVFPLGIDTALYKPAAARKTDASAPKLLYVGRLVDWKRIEFGIEALRLLKQRGFRPTFQIIGPQGDMGYFKKLKDLVATHALEKEIVFLGHVDYEQILPFYQEADILLLPSNRETFGMVMIEAMACGTPVAAVDCPGGPKEVIKDGINGILASENEYHMRVADFFLDGTERAIIRNEARQTVVQRYSIAATYAVLQQSVNDALSATKH